MGQTGSQRLSSMIAMFPAMDLNKKVMIIAVMELVAVMMYSIDVASTRLAV